MPTVMPQSRFASITSALQPRAFCTVRSHSCVRMGTTLASATSVTSSRLSPNIWK